MDISCQVLVNSIGLIADICGAYLLFKFGLPPSIDRNGATFLNLGNNEEEAQIAHKYDRLGEYGLLLLIFGFIFQIISNFI